MKMKRYGVKPVSRPTAVTEGGNLVQVSAEDDVALLLQVEKLKNGSNEGKANFVKYVDNKYGVSPKNPANFIQTIKVLCAAIIGYNVGSGLASTISSAVTYARTLLAKIAGKELIGNATPLKKFEYLKNIRVDSFTQQFGVERLKSIIRMDAVDGNFLMVYTILFSALLTFVFYKIYKALTKSIVSESENKKAIEKYRKLEIQKAALEGKVLFTKSNSLLEGDIDTKQESGSSFIIKIINDAAALCNDMIVGLTNTGTYMMKKHPNFTAALLICSGYVLSF